jgi:hypothetical protein
VTDLDREMPGTDTPSADSGVPPHDAVVELRHVAGLTAGQALPLSVGRFRFGPLRSDEGGLVAGTPDVVSFDLTVHDDGEIVLDVGAEPVAVEGVIIDRPISLSDGDIVQLSTDHFAVEAGQLLSSEARIDSIEPRTIAPLSQSTMTGWFLLFAAITALGAALAFTNLGLLGIALLGAAGIVGTLLARNRRNDRAASSHSDAVDDARFALFADIVDQRKAAARAIRSHARTPAAIAEEARSRSRPPGNQSSVTIASGDQPWEPPVQVRRSPGWDHRSVVDELSFLPAIPYSVDLDTGAVAIVGPRAATLAVARHIVTSAMYVTGPHAGADIETAEAADWRWLRDQPRSAVRILDHVQGDVGPRTIVLCADTHELVANGFDIESFTHLMEIDEAGTAEITTTDGTGTGFVPHGITETHACELQDLLLGPLPSADVPASPSDAAELLDLTLFDTERLLVTGPSLSRNRDVLATAALQQTRFHPDRTLYILDRGDRALIRLAQLENCARYTTIDQIEAVEQMVDELEALIEHAVTPSSLLLAPDLWATVDFYRVTDHHGLADRIDHLVTKMQILPVATSTPATTPDDSASFLVWIETGGTELADVRRPANGGVIDLDALPGSDLTGSVARLTTLHQEDNRR